MSVEVCQKTAKFCKAMMLQLKNKFKNPFIYVHKNKRKYCIVKQKQDAIRKKEYQMRKSLWGVKNLIEGEKLHVDFGR